MGSVSVSSCRCCMFVCVHHVAVLNGAFCMTCNLLMLVEDARGDHKEESLKLHPHTHHIVTPGFVDRPRRSGCTAGRWTKSGNIGLPPLARVMGVGRQQHHKEEEYSRPSLMTAL